MSEFPNIKERLSQAEVLSQRDAFIVASKAIEHLFRGENNKGMSADGSMSLIWNVPEGYHLEIAQSNGSKNYADTIAAHGDHSLDVPRLEFDLEQPLIVHAINASISSENNLEFNLRSRHSDQKWTKYVSFGVSGEDINHFNIQPTLYI